MAELPVTLRDVAQRSGVHPATASRALNPATRMLVSEETAGRVLSAAAALGYRPNTVARSLRTRRSHTVGVLIPDLTNPLFPPIVRGLEDRLAADGYVALIGNTDADDDREQMVFELMRARHVDGFVLATATTHNRVLAEAAEAGLLVVLVNRLAEDFSFPSVSVDNERGIRLAVSHLTGLGHRRIAHVAGPQDTSTGRDRLRGFRAALQAAGLAADPALITHAAAFAIEEGYRCTRELLGAGVGAAGPGGPAVPVCTAIAAGNDMPFIDRLRPPLSTIAFPHYQVGTEAAQLLLERLAGDERPVRSLYLAPELVVRGSTAPPPPGG